MNIINSAFAGLQVQDPANLEKVAELLERFGLRWNVSKSQLFLNDGTPTQFLAVVREDTQFALTTCKDGYMPYQNSELAELVIRIGEKTGYSIHSGGALNGGGKVYLQLDTGNSIKGIGENKTTVKGFITGINGHDGTTSLKWGSANFTICCQNTFSRAAKTLQNSARHTASIHDRVSASLMEIEAITKQEQTLFDKFLRLSEIPATREDIAKVVKNVTGVDLNTSKSEAERIYSTYSVNRAGELTESISKEMSYKGNTLWGLFSGVTHYTSHVMPVPKRENARLESKYVGNGSAIDNRILELI